MRVLSKPDGELQMEIMQGACCTLENSGPFRGQPLPSSSPLLPCGNASSCSLIRGAGNRDFYVNNSMFKCPNIIFNSWHIFWVLVRNLCLPPHLPSRLLNQNRPFNEVPRHDGVTWLSFTGEGTRPCGMKPLPSQASDSGLSLHMSLVPF